MTKEFEVIQVSKDLSAFEPPQCSVMVVKTGQRCPEVGVYKIEDTDGYLCEKCYMSFSAKRQNEHWGHEGNFHEDKS